MFASSSQPYVNDGLRRSGSLPNAVKQRAITSNTYVATIVLNTFFFAQHCKFTVMLLLRFTSGAN